ncbi:MAG: hypothetical protein K0R54_60 [Clostridiaceae bacterium]|nr:hypothetical protein [Clostridiaceae bacterium]
MKKKKILILFLQFCLIIGFGLSFYTYVQNEIEPTEVYIYNKDFTDNIGDKKITEADITLITIPDTAKSDIFATKKEDIIGKYLNTKVYKGQYVYTQQLVIKEDVDPFENSDLSKLRKVSLPITYLDGFAGDVKYGDKVDLLFTGEGIKKTESGDETFKYSKVFLQNLLVYNVATEEGYKFENHSDITKYEADQSLESESSEEISTSGSDEQLAVITLAVTLDQAEEIATRMKSGQIKVIGTFDDSTTYETLGFVLGDYEKVFSGNANAEVGTLK